MDLENRKIGLSSKKQIEKKKSIKEILENEEKEKMISKTFKVLVHDVEIALGISGGYILYKYIPIMIKSVEQSSSKIQTQNIVENSFLKAISIVGGLSLSLVVMWLIIRDTIDIVYLGLPIMRPILEKFISDDVKNNIDTIDKADTSIIKYLQYKIPEIIILTLLALVGSYILDLAQKLTVLITNWVLY